MAILEILQYPDARLNTPARRVEKIDAATRKHFSIEFDATGRATKFTDDKVILRAVKRT